MSVYCRRLFFRENSHVVKIHLLLAATMDHLPQSHPILSVPICHSDHLHAIFLFTHKPSLWTPCFHRPHSASHIIIVHYIENI